MAWQLGGLLPNSGGNNHSNETRLQEFSFSFSFCIVLVKYREFSFYTRGEGKRGGEEKKKETKRKKDFPHGSSAF